MASLADDDGVVRFHHLRARCSGATFLGASFLVAIGSCAAVLGFSHGTSSLPKELRFGSHRRAPRGLPSASSLVAPLIHVADCQQFERASTAASNSRQGRSAMSPPTAFETCSAMSICRAMSAGSSLMVPTAPVEFEEPRLRWCLGRPRRAWSVDRRRRRAVFERLGGTRLAATPSARSVSCPRAPWRRRPWRLRSPPARPWLGSCRRPAPRQVGCKALSDAGFTQSLRLRCSACADCSIRPSCR